MIVITSSLMLLIISTV